MSACSVSQKVGTELGQAPTSQARPPGTDHLRPPNLAARTLSLVEHTLSKFCGGPCPVRRGLSAEVKYYVRKGRFSRCFPLLVDACFHLDSESLRGVWLWCLKPDADHPTLTLTLTRTPWGDQCWDAVACEGSRSIRPARMLWLEGL